MNVHSLLAAILIPTAVAITACSPSKAADNNSESESTASEQFTTVPVAWTDTIHEGNVGGAVNIQADYPSEGPDKAVAAVRQWMAETFDIDNENDLHNGIALVTNAGEKQMLELRSEIADDADMMDFEVLLSKDVNINMLTLTDRYVTYLTTDYVYLGGAHGSTTVKGATFVLASGGRLGYNMFRNDARNSLHKLVVSAIKSEYDDDTFFEPDNIPLPASEPYLVKDGVQFDYQQYEIAPYAAGILSCVIPFDRIKPLLNQPTIDDLGL